MDRLLATFPLWLGILCSLAAGDPVRAPRPVLEKCVDCRLVGSTPTRTPAGGPELPAVQPMPERLPQPDKVVPLPSGRMNFSSLANADKTDPAIKTLVEQYLPDLTDAEQNIWIEELNELPVGIAREMLLARERSGGGLALESEQIFGQDQRADEPRIRRRTDTPGIGNSKALERTLDILRQAEAVVLNNIANANTIGFKRRIPFTSAAAYGLAGLVTGRSQTQGSLVETGHPFDLALEGPGFFQVTRNGRVAVTRAGRFRLNKKGIIVTTIEGQDWLLYPQIIVPASFIELAISPDGTVQVRQSLDNSMVSSGRIRLILVGKRLQLKRIAPGLWSIPNGLPTQNGNPGQPGFASIRDGYLESSNVDLSRAVQRLEDIRRQLEALNSAFEPQSRKTRRENR